MFKILIVEDDKKIREIILENIQKWGYQGQTVEDFNGILQGFVQYNPHLVLLDINLPYFDGYYWCQKIREVSQVPIIFISSRDSNMDIIMAMNMGGDDYIQKPFSLEVLMAKIKAILRRTYAYINAESNVVEHDGVVLNLQDNTLLYKEEKVDLTKNEFQICSILLKNSGAVVSREEMMRELWKDESFVDDNTLTVNINRLRRKLAKIGLEHYIETKRGQGYLVK